MRPGKHRRRTTRRVVLIVAIAAAALGVALGLGDQMVASMTDVVWGYSVNR
jgi:hypothetical protein